MKIKDGLRFITYGYVVVIWQNETKLGLEKRPEKLAK
jgi:hypothetical protein